MNTSKTIKKFLNELILSEKVTNQQEFGESLGYMNKSSFSQLMNKEEVSDNFIKKVKQVYPEFEEWLLTGEGSMLKEDIEDREGYEVKILPVSAEGGRLDGFSTQVRDEDCEKLISPIKDVDFAMTVTGDSMYPEYPSGSKILVKKINERAFIEWGRVYVLDTCNGAVIKKIIPSQDTEKVKCVSINPEYAPFEVSFEDIFGMYRVLMCMSLK